jgi:hypothetical protein
VKTQLIFGLVITALTLVGLLALPVVYHFALAVFGLGCVSMSLVFALLIDSMNK